MLPAVCKSAASLPADASAARAPCPVFRAEGIPVCSGAAAGLLVGFGIHEGICVGVGVTEGILVGSGIRTGTCVDIGVTEGIPVGFRIRAGICVGFEVIAGIVVGILVGFAIDGIGDNVGTVVRIGVIPAAGIASS